MLCLPRAPLCSAIALALVLCTAASSMARADGAGKIKTVERIVAVVNDEIVLLSELNSRIGPMLAQLQQVPDSQMRKQREQELFKQALDHMVGEKLIGQEARKLKLTVSDQELERAVTDVMTKNNLTREQLSDALEREGRTISAYKFSVVRPQLLRLKVLNVAVRSRVSVSEDELKAKYQNNLRELGVQTKVRARHIFVAIPDHASNKVVADKRRLAQALLARVKKGEDFAELARKHSTDSVTRAEGGDLGYFSRGTLPAPIEDVVFAMKKGEVRGPLRTPRGFHLIKLTDRQESSARPYKEVRRELREQLYSEKLEKSTQAWLREVRKRSHVEVRL